LRGVRSVPEPEDPPALNRYIGKAVVTDIALAVLARWAHEVAADKAEVVHWLGCMPNGTVAEKPSQ